eukprot:8397343-Lingulodinium_polyedra.AAC.1
MAPRGSVGAAAAPATGVGACGQWHLRPRRRGAHGRVRDARFRLLSPPREGMQLRGRHLAAPTPAAP